MTVGSWGSRAPDDLPRERRLVVEASEGCSEHSGELVKGVEAVCDTE